MDWRRIFGGIIFLIVVAAGIEAYIKRNRRRPLLRSAPDQAHEATTPMGMQEIDMTNTDRIIKRHQGKGR